MSKRSHKTFAAVAAASLLALPLSACSLPGGGSARAGRRGAER